jgi:D-cysteine desulfhydrase family pyridoxal phosphate-dependent enzyme
MALTTSRNKLQITQVERLGLIKAPTPFERMPRLEAELDGPQLFVKRDDLTPLAMGGNKVRHLDYMLVEAKKRHADVVVAACGLQSNWARQTIGAATTLGMKTVLVLRTAQFKRKPTIYDGNILLDHILGADINVVNMRMTDDPRQIMESVAERLRKKGHNPYIVPDSHTTLARGVVSYFDAMKEIAEQARAFRVKLDVIVVAVGGGVTQSGLMLGSKVYGMKTKVIGVLTGASDKKVITNSILETSAEAARLLGLETRLSSNDIKLLDDYEGEDYGTLTKEAREAIILVARKEGLLLDPVYTSKAMAALIGMTRDGELAKGQNVCFLHTGGVPALFAYSKYFQPSSARKMKALRRQAR